MKLVSKIYDLVTDNPLYLVLFIVALLVIALSVQPIDGSLVSDQLVKTELERSYSSVVMDQKQVSWLFTDHGCGRDNSAVYDFSAVATNNRPVEGTACVRAFSHQVFVTLK